eukprot:CAMPEP_0116898492 /NCGR_PEP_ID=MMETSP0467-20121206/7212_1 /TAXON_ID=283647 /ORGANISM="Mesodinium pulex, Strain SPMC105" /LENGTH=212 /DNA_ID=CAMNT_0004570669 /DNA_START=16 /DNA_END=652 /DNA_ORIENTATION=-
MSQERSSERGREASPAREAAAPVSKIFVGNLSYTMTERDLEDVFSKYGRVSEARLATDRNTGRAKGFAFVSMEDAADAKAAVDGLTDYEFDGRIMTVQFSHGEGGAEVHDQMSVTIGRRVVATEAAPADSPTARMAEAVEEIAIEIIVEETVTMAETVITEEIVITEETAITAVIPTVTTAVEGAATDPEIVPETVTTAAIAETAPGTEGKW